MSRHVEDTDCGVIKVLQSDDDIYDDDDDYYYEFIVLLCYFTNEHIYFVILKSIFWQITID